MNKIVGGTFIAIRIFFLLSIFSAISCTSTSQKMTDQSPYTNHLINETSPYLLQHAHNPVDWYPWSDEAWKKAKDENKLVVVSIGYSSCHWCHVMEHESFEDTAVASVMNKNFICIKVDREERPDIDQVYMTAAQIMTGGGGWPLNCIALPNGKPIYAGTYFPKSKWINLLQQLAEYYRSNQKEAEDYAAKVADGIQQVELVHFNDEEASFHLDSLKNAVANWKDSFDNQEGGMKRAPKFPMPNNYEFLLRYYAATKDETVLNHVLLTLNKMAYGGIYDQLGGGFARYSTDSLWKVPHFEKMLYDNAQLVSIYSMAYQQTKNELYKQIVFETLDFTNREMTSIEGGFYSALDADSEGEEGKFYVWKKDELEKLLGTRFKIFAEYFSVNEIGYWENGNYILLRKQSDEEIAKQFGISVDGMKKEIADDKKILLDERNKRIHPALDDKQLTSWNALMTKACCDAYNAFGEKQFLDAALMNANLNWSKLWQKDGGYFHSYKDGRASVNGFLEDYSFSAEAFIALYQCTFDVTWLQNAKEITDYALKHFYDEQSKMFFFTSDEAPSLIARKMEVNDNVIPASNSSMAKALFTLGIYFDDENYS
ncbi:MAG: thioredoxin domain-containing protein, partial [Chitinophagales bacterium]